MPSTAGEGLPESVTADVAQAGGALLGLRLDVELVVQRVDGGGELLAVALDLGLEGLRGAGRVRRICVPWPFCSAVESFTVGLP